ncbi:MAG: hypothetical protein LH650_06875, partial [Chloroflexi bacterium]|nr:hypothetical protein [Chloroflexota bacterium]
LRASEMVTDAVRMHFGQIGELARADRVSRATVDEVVPDVDATRLVRIETLLGAAGSAASGTGTAARDHDAVLAEDRW